jgi:hypothetical protein
LSDCHGLLIRAIASTDEGSDCISRIQIASHSQKGKNTESSSNPTMSYKKVLMSIQSFTKTTELDRTHLVLFIFQSKRQVQISLDVLDVQAFH